MLAGGVVKPGGAKQASPSFYLARCKQQVHGHPDLAFSLARRVRVADRAYYVLSLSPPFPLINGVHTVQQYLPECLSVVPMTLVPCLPAPLHSTAITAVAPCEEGCRYALRLLVLMQEEQVAPDRFTLTAIGKPTATCRPSCPPASESL